jgi:urease accessory protein UreE
VYSSGQPPVFCQSLLGNVFADPEVPAAAIDWVGFYWDECRRRALRKRSQLGVDCRILLSPGAVIRHGDVIFRYDDGLRIAARIEPCDVLVARPTSFVVATTLAYELGNLHWPMQISAAEHASSEHGDNIPAADMPWGELLTIPDGPAEVLFAQLQLALNVERRRFEPGPVGARPELSADFRIMRRDGTA